MLDAGVVISKEQVQIALAVLVDAALEETQDRAALPMEAALFSGFVEPADGLIGILGIGAVDAFGAELALLDIRPTSGILGGKAGGGCGERLDLELTCLDAGLGVGGVEAKEGATEEQRDQGGLKRYGCAGIHGSFALVSRWPHRKKPCGSARFLSSVLGFW